MEQTRITFVINGNTYSLTPADTSAIRAMPADDRQALMPLLEAVEREEAAIAARARDAEQRAKALLDGVGQVAASRAPSPERLGKGDADALMARLVMEDNMSRKPGPTKQGLYKVVIGLMVAIFLLVLIF